MIAGTRQRILAARGTRSGSKGPDNQDSVLLVPPEDGGDAPLLCAVADGVGGLERGAAASRAAIDALASAFNSNGDAGGSLKTAIAQAHHAVRREAATGATTMVAGVVAGADLWVANAGDSRAYLYTPGRGLAQVTADHSWVQEQVRAGAMAQEEAANHPQRKVITRCLGGPEPPEVDVFHKRLVPGARLLLCSDGLTEVVSDGELAEVIARYEPEDAVARLLELAEQRHALDDATLCIVEPEIDATAAAPEDDETGEQRLLRSPLPLGEGQGEGPLRHILLWTCLVAAVTLLGTVLWRATDDNIVPGVHAAGVDLSGLSEAEAAAQIDSALSPRLSCRQVIVTGAAQWPVTPAALGVAPDGSAVATEAMLLGHLGEVRTQAEQRLDIAMNRAEVAPRWRIDQPVLEAKLAEIDQSYRGSIPGQALDMPAAIQAARQQLAAEPCRKITLPTVAVAVPEPATGVAQPPAVTRAHVAQPPSAVSGRQPDSEALTA